MDHFPDDETFWAEMARDPPDLDEAAAKLKLEELFMMRRLYLSMSSEGISREIWTFLEVNDEIRYGISQLLFHLHCISKSDPKAGLILLRQLQKAVRRAAHV